MVTVRDDGILAALAPVIAGCGVEVAVLVDVDSGMLLDAWSPGGDPEALGAAHADVVRALIAAGTPAGELVLTQDGCRHHLVRCLADPVGGRLALAAVVRGSSWVVRRTLKRLREVPDGCLMAGPLPLPAGQGGWGDPPPGPHPLPDSGRTPAIAQIDPSWTLRPARPIGHRASLEVASRRSPAPPSAIPPARREGGS